MLPLGPHGQPEPADDLNYWYPRHVRYAEALAVERIQSRKAFIWTLRCEGGRVDIIENMERELAQNDEPISKSKEEFGPWWTELEEKLRAVLMEKYEKGLDAVLREDSEKTQGALRKYMKKRHREE